MGFLDKAKELLGKHDDKVDQGLNKVGDAAKQKFAGHEEHIDKATGMARDKTGEGDTTQGQPGQAPPPGEAPPPPPGQGPPPQQ
ncbi:antitoxin [Pseudonocardia nantongensis]|uniref:antitoxin n=1 Tax=Pseudonocardia nantongensis TaxID=1181885 RepID=UPI00397BC16F